jgi:hypothetical protein
MTDNVENAPGRGPGKLLAVIIIAAVIVRVITAVTSDSFNHPDENFQVLEQAHRLVFGYGFVPWEYRFSARSWIVPDIMAILLYPFKVLGLDNPNIYVPSIKILLSLFSIIVVISAYHIGKNIFSPKAGLWAAFFCALWYESVYFSVRPLSEVWATMFFMAAYALSFYRRSKTYVVLAALLACLSAAVRINYIPAVIVLLIISILRLEKGWRKRYLLSIIAGVLLVGVFETVTQGKPFISYINFYNIDKSFFMAGPPGSFFSTDYLRFLGYSSFYLYYVMLIAGILFWRKNGRMISIILIALLSHVLIPAKGHQIDYRHIYVVIPLILTVGGITVAVFVDRIEKMKPARLLSAAVAGVFLLVSITGALASLPGQHKVYEQRTFNVYNNNIFYSNPRLEAYRYLYGQEDLRGLYDASDSWFRSGGFYYLHRDVPVYFSNTPPSSPDYVSHIILRGTPEQLNGFKKIKSFDDIIIYARTDKNFQHGTDANYTRDMLQLDVDSRPR